MSNRTDRGGTHPNADWRHTRQTQNTHHPAWCTSAIVRHRHRANHPLARAAATPADWRRSGDEGAPSGPMGQRPPSRRLHVAWILRTVTSRRSRFLKVRRAGPVHAHASLTRGLLQVKGNYNDDVRVQNVCSFTMLIDASLTRGDSSEVYQDTASQGELQLYNDGSGGF